MKKAFTLVELIVVIAVIAILMAALGTGVRKAQSRSRIARAEAETGEITSAIRAYRNYVDDGIPIQTAWSDADESGLDYILGGRTDRAGKPVPVLYNASVMGGKIRDPWGTPYQFRVVKAEDSSESDDVATSMETGVFLPNRYNRLAEAGQ